MSDQSEVSPVKGMVDSVDNGAIGGWVRSSDARPLSVVAYVNGQEVGRTIAAVPRPDLQECTGFAIPIAFPNIGNLLLQERLVVAVDHQPTWTPLDVADGLRLWLVTHLFASYIPRLDASHLRAVLANIQAHLVGDNRDYTVLEVLPGTPDGEMTKVTVPVGLRSLDHEAVIGRQGHVFLARGSNALLHQYRQEVDDPTVVAAAAAWVDLVRRRIAATAPFPHLLQCIIPEKASLLSDCFPVPIAGRTAIMRVLGPALLADPETAPHYLDASTVLSDPQIRAEAFQKVDTHLAPIGAFAVAAEILRRVGADEPLDVAFEETLTLGGDVGRRLLSPYARETMPAPSGTFLAGLGARLERVEHHATPTMTGMRVVYRNPGALYDMKIVAFANSFFDVGDNPTQISWWLARLVTEYQFIWSSELDSAYCERQSPDVVICQTIERFLSTLPSA